MRITESQLRKEIQNYLLTENQGNWGGYEFAIWSHLKGMASRLKKPGQSKEEQMEEAMKWMASTAGYAMKGVEVPNSLDEEVFSEETAEAMIMDYARANRKKSLKSFCMAFIDGLYNTLAMSGEDPLELYKTQIFRILQNDRLI